MPRSRDADPVLNMVGEGPPLPLIEEEGETDGEREIAPEDEGAREPDGDPVGVPLHTQ